MIRPGVTNFIPYTYTGKIEGNTFVYPYTNDVFCALLTNENDDDGCGKFVFSNSSNCTAKYDRIDGFNNSYIEITITTNGTSITTNTNNISGWLGLSSTTVEFTKQ